MNWRIALFLVAFLLTMGTLILFPGIDLGTSRLFYAPGAGFSHASWLESVHAHLGWLVGAITIGSLALLFVPGRRRAAVFLLLSLALGPGLLVNTVFKDHWGRARPAQLVQFGGDKRFSPAFVPSDQCPTNCSFPAGDPAVGFFLVSAALLLPGAAARRGAIVVAVTLGAALGLMRLSQGGHFLSDVVASGFLVTAVGWALYRLLIAWDGIGALAAALRHPAPGLKRFAFVSLVLLAAAALSLAFFDLPLARAAHDQEWAWKPALVFVTQFGVSTAYLAIAGIGATVLRIAGRRRAAWRAAYVFLAVAVSGLVGDILKPVIGRARPKLLLGPDQIYGFTWFGPQADYWSMPSGHTVTAAALAFALSLLYPRFTAAWIAAALLVGASRVLLDAHYLSDVLIGFYIGIACAWAIAAVLRERGIVLSDSP
jgi:lipid A 4'-phosphatase